ncbi:hypothetical protein SF285071_2331 [Shigella flexneri 2850-71]|nr:hypothetical protein SF285071_2331 [Shigella flexneri 2850-71]
MPFHYRFLMYLAVLLRLFSRVSFVLNPGFSYMILCAKNAKI